MRVDMDERDNPFAEVRSNKDRLLARVDPFHRPGGLLNFRASIIWSCVPELIIFTVVATIVVVIDNFHGLDLPITLLSVLGVVLGFIISYRTSSAYERYSEGRKYWSQLVLAERTWARMIWHHIPSPEGASEQEVIRATIEKKMMINISGAFAVALKHHLRGEPGHGYKDLYPLLSFLPRYYLPLPPEQVVCHHRTDNPPSSTMPDGIQPGLSDSVKSPSIHADSVKPPSIRRLQPPYPLLPSRNPPATKVRDFVPLYAFFSDIYRFISKDKSERKVLGRKARRFAKITEEDGLQTNLPLELTLIMTAWVAAITRRKAIEVPILKSLLIVVASFSDSLAGLERILFTPLPVSYALHLQQSIYLYLFLLPSQIHASFGWLTIPVTFIVSFVFLGFLRIGEEIENPFGYDLNDLDLDAFCHTILQENDEVTAHDPSELDPDNYGFVDSNLPFSHWPEWQGRSAKDYVDDPTTTMAEIRETLKEAGGKVRFRAKSSSSRVRQAYNVKEDV